MIKIGKSMLKTSYSWRGNDIIRKQIPRFNDTVTKMSISIRNELSLITFLLLPLILCTAERLKTYVTLSSNQIIEQFITHSQVRLNSSTI